MDHSLSSVTFPGSRTVSYAYDDAGRRTSITYPGGTNEVAYCYDAANRLTSVTGWNLAATSYAYDDAGRMTTATLPNRASDTFAWDYEDRMTSATVNSVTTTFAYRGDGLCDSRTTGGTTTTFAWDINAGLPVVLDDGSRYVYGAGLVSQVSGTNSYYYLADGLGSTMATTDAAGNVVNQYAYDVYGKVTSSSGSQANEFQFAGQQTDPRTGLQYLPGQGITTWTRGGLFLESRWRPARPQERALRTVYCQQHPNADMCK
jgi:YD repeat-containing protein